MKKLLLLAFFTPLFAYSMEELSISQLNHVIKASSQQIQAAAHLQDHCYRCYGALLSPKYYCSTCKVSRAPEVLKRIVLVEATKRLRLASDTLNRKLGIE